MLLNLEEVKGHGCHCKWPIVGLPVQHIRTVVTAIKKPVAIMIYRLFPSELAFLLPFINNVFARKLLFILSTAHGRFVLFLKWCVSRTKSLVSIDKEIGRKEGL